MTTILVIVLLAILANYRLGRLFYKDTILDPLRLFIRKRASNKRSIWWWLAEWFGCPHCIGIWTAALIVVLLSLYYRLDFEECLLMWLAIAGGQSFLQSIVSGDFFGNDDEENIT